jgi:hypothetical protein
MVRIKLVFSIVAFLGLATAAIVAMLLQVRESAREIAGRSPYCIQVPDDAGDYKPARTLFDLSVLKMWATREAGMYMQNHAILLVGSDTSPQLFHWSYRTREFVPGVLNERAPGYGPAITCMPEPDFVGGLPWIIAQKQDSDFVRFSADEAYRIPKDYGARWNGGARRWLFIGAPAPDFHSLGRSLAPGDRDSNGIFVEWNPQWLLNLMKSVPRNADAERGGIALDAQPDGANATLIRCGAPTQAFPKSCQHRFLNKGRHFYFRHRPEDLPRWREMQSRVVDLFSSFDVTSSPQGAVR